MEYNHAASGPRSRPLVLMIAVTLALFFCQKIALAQTTSVSPKTPITLPNGKQIHGFDISWADPFSRVFLLSDGGNSEVDVVDVNTDTVIGAVTGFTSTVDPNFTQFSHLSGPTGVTTVNHIEAWAGDAPSFAGPIVLNSDPVAGYATDNCNSSVKVIDLVTQKITDSVNVGGCFRSDELAFDPVDQVVMLANPEEINIGKSSSVPFITLISAQPALPGQHHKILKKINFDGTNGTPNANCAAAGCTIEQTTYSPDTGLFYVATDNGTNAAGTTANDVVAVIDPRGDADDMGVVAIYPVPNCGGVTGTAIKKYTLFIGCGNASTFMDIRSGTILGTVQVPGPDEVWYDRGTDLFLAVTFPPDSTFYTIDGTSLQVSQSIPMAGNLQGIVHTLAADSVTKQTFIPVPAGGTVCGAAPNNGCIAVFGP